MNMYPSFTSLRSFVTYQFSLSRMHALRNRFWKKLTGTELSLPIFSEQDRRISPSLKSIGIKNIRVAEIVGTLNRDTDFDPQFRPLKKHNADRWINAYLLHELDGWSPILVHKVENEYFVEDGHHRVSVARAIGMEFIEAKVWEYTVQNFPVEIPKSPCCSLESKPAKAYAVG